MTELMDLGVVQLNSAPGWRFFPTPDRIAARPANGVGILQIVRLPDDAVLPPPSHERCMSVAVEASQYYVEGPGADRALETGECCLAGGESFESGGDFVRIWYRHCADGMIAAWFSVKLNRAHEKAVQQSVRQCDQMIATARVPPPLA